MSRVLDPRSVMVFGGGIAGLTAAHELSERGFMVTVWERDNGERSPPGRSELGGMARTQWSRVEWPTYVRRPEQQMRRTDPPIFIREEIYFEPDRATPADPAEAARTLAAVAAQLNALGTMEVSIEGFGPTKEISEARAAYVRDQLVEVHGVENPRLAPAYGRLPEKYRLEVWGLGDVYEPDRPARKRDHVRFAVRQRLLPGEHGFRFFPAFYWHLFDTMRRTPILEDAPVSPVEAAERRAFLDRYGRFQDREYEVETRLVETARTVYDNLVPTSTQAIIGEREHAPALIPRRRLRSFEATWRALHALLTTMRYTLDDIRRFELKLFKYLTSSSARREKEYEAISWWDFLEGDSYSPGFQEAMDSWPQALVAMTAREGDARTQGDVSVQLLLDQIADVRYADGTLNAPTSEAWFAHWRRYLQMQGVEFVHGELQGMELDAEGQVRLKLRRFDGREARQIAGFYVIALPLQEAMRLVTPELIEAHERARSATPGDVGRAPRDETLRRIREFPIGGLDRPHPRGALQHLSGIQYYFAEDIQWVHGHTYYPDSDWGLSSISQALFWREKLDIRDGYRGTLSVCIANWYKKSRRTGKCAWESSPDEVAREVWSQIVEGLKSRSARPARPGDDPAARLPFEAPPEPLFYHIDYHMRFREDGRGVLENRSPLLINHPDEWRIRPGEPDDYRVYFDCVVFAGTYMKTHTRLTTMESANESARHAVNAILREAERVQPSGRAGNLCSIWPLEEREMEDLQMLRDLDERLLARGLPHFLEIVGIDGPGAAPGGAVIPAAALEALRRLAGAAGEEMAAQLRALLEALAARPE